jgi:predicted RNase H-like HicB family nuclease
MERLPLTAIYEPVENGWIQARINELPEVITAAPTQAEAKDMLLDALREYLLSLADDAEPAPIGPNAKKEALELSLSN